MQFVVDGPDIPDALLQAHEEGRVVFFCGAGVSYPAGLPGFKGLVEEIYRRNGTTPVEIERAALERDHYDVTLDLLERRLPGQRLAVRRALAESLKPKLRRNGATDTHAALLRLARSRGGALRLVTTNFDRVFHAAAKRTRQSFQSYAAPMLPIPKNSRWDGVVHLHGLLPEKEKDTELNKLVVTSGDFGLAYLTERWAARFVSELFGNYVVCFVGYSINDPVLRYMMDALAADRRMGEAIPTAWALGDCEPGQEASTSIEWETKGVTPILYRLAAGKNRHSGLHQTLQAWAATYRDGVTGKERIVVAHALARPSASTRQDDFVGRMLWALSDPSGLPAKRFADLNPVPSLNWLLDAFAGERYGHSDLARFGVPPGDDIDTELQFSLIDRPTPYGLAPRMRLVVGWASRSWDDVMFHLARWLLRHLDDPRLVLWIAEQGGQLHDQLACQIERELDRLSKLEGDGRVAELDAIRTHAPNAVPRPLMRKLWRLLLTSRVKSPRRRSDLYQWKRRLGHEGLTATLRLELRELLSPKVSLRKPFNWGEESEPSNESAHLRQLVSWELVLASDHVYSALRDLAGEQWRAALPLLLEDVQRLLRDALDLLGELGSADERTDRSYWDLPSVTPHWQNRRFRDWVFLIELLRDAWLVVRGGDGDRASRIATAWFDLPYPTFKRLALFAASHEGCLATEDWVEWLVVDGAWWLWAADTRREVLRLLVLQGGRLTPASQERLETTLLIGPPREMYQDDLDSDRWEGVVAHSVWLRLAKLRSSGLVLRSDSAARLAELSSRYPEWRLSLNERDEFSHWMSGTGDPDYEESRDVDIAPRKRRELVQWLVKPPPEERPLYEDTWRDVCRTRFFHSLFALCDLARGETWPVGRWREALQVWGEDSMVLRSWRYAAPLVQAMPDAVVEEIVHVVTWWLRAAARSSNRHEVILLSMCRRVLGLPLADASGIRRVDGESIQEPVAEAINHPVGHVAQALIDYWFKRKPNDGDRLPIDIAPLFTQLCDAEINRFRHGRVLLSSQLVALFRVDPVWTEEHLLPRFDWTVDQMEAKSVWEGFLWSPRLYQPLLLAIKPQFLETARRYSELGQHAEQFATFLTYAALGPVEGYTTEDWRDALGSLPPQGLTESAQALAQALEGAADQREDYWRNRVQPFWVGAWPKSRDLVSPDISEPLARLCLAAGGEFPAALTAVQEWLLPVAHPDYVIDCMKEASSRFPGDALRFLAAIIGDQPWIGPELGRQLDVIEQADPSLARRTSFQRLREHARKHGG